MNTKEYLAKHANTPEKLREFAALAKTSPMYVRHVANGHKDKPGLEVALGLIRASSGRIKIKTLRPDLFKDDDSLRLLRKSAA